MTKLWTWPNLKHCKQQVRYKSDIKFVFPMIGKHCGKKEKIAGNQYFLLFPVFKSRPPQGC